MSSKLCEFISYGGLPLLAIQVYWPARRLSAPNLGLVRMNSVSEEQEEEEEEGEELVVKATKKSDFEEGETREMVAAHFTEGGDSSFQAGRNVESKKFAAPLPLAVG